MLRRRSFPFGAQGVQKANFQGQGVSFRENSDDLLWSRKWLKKVPAKKKLKM